MHSLAVLLAYIKQNLKEAFAYRVDTLVNIGTMLMWTGWELTTLGIIFNNTSTIGGWRIGDMIVLMGEFRLAHTFMMMLAGPNTENFNRGIREGTLDYTFLQPLDSQFAVSFQKMVVWRVFDLLLGAAIVLLGLFYCGSSAARGGRAPFCAAHHLGHHDHLQPLDRTDRTHVLVYQVRQQRLADAGA